jgi:hypothetical protein
MPEPEYLVRKQLFMKGLLKPRKNRMESIYVPAGRRPSGEKEETPGRKSVIVKIGLPRP